MIVFDETSDSVWDNSGSTIDTTLPSYSWGASTSASTPDGGISLGGIWGGLSNAASGAVDLTKSLASGYFGVQNTALGVAQQKNVIDLQSKINTNNQKVAMMQSDWAARMGVQMPTDASSLYGSNNITTTLANMQRSLSNSLGSSSLMTWLTVAGVVIAFMQYSKAK